MANNFQFLNDKIYTFPVLTTNSAGTVEPPPAGDTFTAVADLPASLNVAMGTTAAGGPAVVANALVAASPGRTIKVSDSAGLAVFVLTLDIVADVADTNVLLDTADATTTSQAVPTAPGP